FFGMGFYLPISARETCDGCGDGHATGGSGNDVVGVIGGVADGGSGSDEVYGSARGDAVLGGSGSDAVFGSYFGGGRGDGGARFGVLAGGARSWVGGGRTRASAPTSGVGE